MQVKKPGGNPSSDYPSNSSPMSNNTDDVFRKKIILMGASVGIIGAAAAGVVAWFWYNGTLKMPSKPVASNNAIQMKKLDPVVVPKSEPMPVFSPPENSNETPIETPKESQYPKINKDLVVPKRKKNKVPHRWDDDSTIVPMQNSKRLSSQFPGINAENYQYNALKPGPVISVTRGATVEVSRGRLFQSLYISGKANKNGEFIITNPPPGAIYWRIKGDTEVHKIIIDDPASTQLEFKAADKLNLGDIISWKGNQNVSYFRIEVSDDSSFAGSVRTFSTKETSMNTLLIGAGTWFVRLAAMNIQSGSFEYSQINSIQIHQDSSSQENTPTVQPEKLTNAQMENASNAPQEITTESVISEEKSTPITETSAAASSAEDSVTLKDLTLPSDGNGNTSMVAPSDGSQIETIGPIETIPATDGQSAESLSLSPSNDLSAPSSSYPETSSSALSGVMPDSSSQSAPDMSSKLSTLPDTSAAGSSSMPTLPDASAAGSSSMPTLPDASAAGSSSLPKLPSL